jgi:hypothetical protein
MKISAFTRQAGLAAALVVASMFVVPMASARVHVGVGIAFPGVSVGVGNCWRCGYWAPPPPVYYAPAYPAPAYYPAPGYYAPPPVYYGYSYGYYAPYYHRHYHRQGYDRDHGRRHGDHGGYYHHHH